LTTSRALRMRSTVQALDRVWSAGGLTDELGAGCGPVEVCDQAWANTPSTAPVAMTDAQARRIGCGYFFRCGSTLGSAIGLALRMRSSVQPEPDDWPGG